MTENEAIEIHIAESLHRIGVIEEFLRINSDADDKECNKTIQVLTKINGALQEIQRYRAIGTVQELRGLKESALSDTKILKKNVSVLEKVLEKTESLDSGWIACEDRFPEDEATTYLVCLKNGGIFLAVYIIDKFVMISPTGTRKFYENNPVIAWQPLPEPYKPTEGGGRK